MRSAWCRTAQSPTGEQGCRPSLWFSSNYTGPLVQWNTLPQKPDAPVGMRFIPSLDWTLSLNDLNLMIVRLFYTSMTPVQNNLYMGVFALFESSAVDMQETRSAASEKR